MTIGFLCLVRAHDRERTIARAGHNKKRNNTGKEFYRRLLRSEKGSAEEHTSPPFRKVPVGFAFIVSTKSGI